jgi:hypothetical protein
MVQELGNIELENGIIYKFWSDKLGKSFYVVQFNDWGYINIFDESKERIAVTSLLDRDISCQDRDSNLPLLLVTETEGAIFNEYCDILEELDFNYKLAEEKFFQDFPMPWHDC